MSGDRQTPASGQDPARPWARQEGETDAAWDAFCGYRKLGLRRSLSRVAELLGHDHLSTLKGWSAAHDWVARCRAFDDHQDALAEEAAEEERRALARRHARAAVRLQSEFISRIFDEDRPIVDRLAELAHSDERTDSGSAVISASAQVSAIKALIDGAYLKPVAGVDGGDLDLETRKKIVESELAAIAAALPKHERLMFAGLLEKGFALLREARDGD